MDKRTARRKGLENRAALCESERIQRSRIIQEKVIQKLKDACVIGCYVSMKDEVSTGMIRAWCLENGKTLAVPKVTGSTLVFHSIEGDEDLKTGCFGVREPYKDNPVKPEDIDFMIVPLSAFDQKGNRTGYGRGYYDSILKQCRYKAGIAYREQMMDQIETDPWDVPLDEIIYE